jgi:hypothetical protein
MEAWKNCKFLKPWLGSWGMFVEAFPQNGEKPCKRFFWAKDFEDLILTMFETLAPLRNDHFVTSGAAEDKILEAYTHVTNGDLAWSEIIPWVNQVTTPYALVVWFGVFQELLEGSDWFSRNARACYYLREKDGYLKTLVNLGLTKKTLRKSAKPIPMDKTYDFLAFIQNVD